jgi:hypothetical protein
MKKQFWRFVLLLAILSASLQFVNAQVRPAMAVYAVWTPDKQLTSITGDDRYVDLQIYAQGNVPFWAVNISCTVGTPAQLDLVGTLSFPSAWGNLADGLGGDDGYYYSPQTDAALYSGTGVLAFTATRVGTNNSQLGMNGQDYTQLITTARFKVQNLAANATVTVNCTTMEFIDRNGAVVFRAAQTRLNNLMIYVGYTLTGSVRRQGTTSHSNIEVTCGLLSNFDSTKRTVFTTATGGFSFGGAASVLRHLGVYRCTFESEFVQGVPNSQILLGYMDFDMDTAIKNLLPVTLRTGDANNSGTIEFSDVTSVAAANGANVGAFGSNDMNGDGIVNRLDIIFPAGNMGLSDSPNGLLSEHVLYGLGRDRTATIVFPNSRIWLGTPNSGDLVNFNARGTTRDFWPTLSPDGSSVAYISQTGTAKHKLATLAVNTGISTPFNFPLSFAYDAFAPSWSPDGNRIAFICATNSANSGYLYNQGDICIINVVDRTGARINRLNVQSRIFPPTWLSYDTDTLTAGEQTGYVLLYGGVDGDIHYYDLVDSAHGTLAFDAGTVSSADIVDMPVISKYLYSFDTYLAYRYNDTGDGLYDPHVRIGTIAYNGTAFSAGVVGVLDADHVSLAASTTGVDYYDVSPGLDIMFYREYNFAKANFPSQDPYLMVTLPHDNNSILAWLAPINHIPDSSVAHPVNTTDVGTIIYNPASPNFPSYLHVWRMSFDYVP